MKENCVLQRKPAWRKSLLKKNSIQKEPGTRWFLNFVYRLVFKEHKT